MRRTIVALIVLWASIFVLPPAGATSTDLLHPTSIALMRGTSPTANTDAPPLVASEDSSTYDITSAMRHGTAVATYSFKIRHVASRSTDLALQWNGQPSLTCSLRLALWDWSAGKWRGQTFTADSSAETLQTFDATRPNRFIRRHVLRGLVSCSLSGSDFAFSTNRIRVPDQHN
jgi:hypothetical protein